MSLRTIPFWARLTVAALAIYALTAAVAVYGGPREDAIARVVRNSVSVVVEPGGGTGSGVIIRKGSQAFVLTAGHVLDHVTNGFPEVRQDISPKIVRGYSAKILAFEHSNKEDFGVLWVTATPLPAAWDGVIVSAEPPPVGTEVWHVGSLYGQSCSHSFSSGVVAYRDRIRSKIPYDQVTCVVYQGSSGGGVFTSDGRLVGVVIALTAPNIAYSRPVHHFRQWLEAKQLGWLLDPKQSAPSRAKLQEMKP